MIRLRNANMRMRIRSNFETRTQIAKRGAYTRWHCKNAAHLVKPQRDSSRSPADPVTAEIFILYEWLNLKTQLLLFAREIFFPDFLDKALMSQVERRLSLERPLNPERPHVWSSDSDAFRCADEVQLTESSVYPIICIDAKNCTRFSFANRDSEGLAASPCFPQKDKWRFVCLKVIHNFQWTFFILYPFLFANGVCQIYYYVSKTLK